MTQSREISPLRKSSHVAETNFEKQRKILVKTFTIFFLNDHLKHTPLLATGKGGLEKPNGAENINFI